MQILKILYNIYFFDYCLCHQTKLKIIISVTSCSFVLALASTSLALASTLACPSASADGVAFFFCAGCLSPVCPFTIGVALVILALEGRVQLSALMLLWIFSCMFFFDSNRPFRSLTLLRAFWRLPMDLLRVRLVLVWGKAVVFGGVAVFV